MLLWFVPEWRDGVLEWVLWITVAGIVLSFFVVSPWMVYRQANQPKVAATTGESRVQAVRKVLAWLMDTAPEENPSPQDAEEWCITALVIVETFFGPDAGTYFHSLIEGVGKPDKKHGFIVHLATAYIAARHVKLHENDLDVAPQASPSLSVSNSAAINATNCDSKDSSSQTPLTDSGT